MLSIIDYVNLRNKERAHRRKYRKSGIYGFFINGECLYVGKSKNLGNRFISHAENFAKVRLPKEEQYKKYELLRPYADHIEWRVLEETADIDTAEFKWIEYYDNPVFNVKLSGCTQHFEGDAWDIELFVSGQEDISYLKKLVRKR